MIEKAIKEALRYKDRHLFETPRSYIALLGWEHINLIGRYHFAPRPGRSLDNLRLLRVNLSNER